MQYLTHPKVQEFLTKTGVPDVVKWVAKSIRTVVSRVTGNMRLPATKCEAVGMVRKLHPLGLTRHEWMKLSDSKRTAYTPMRKRINHPNVKGPMETDWGTTDFEVQMRDVRIGLPALPGQVTN